MATTPGASAGGPAKTSEWIRSRGTPQPLRPAVSSVTAPAVVARPEVLVSLDEAAALRQLIGAIAARQVEAMDIPQLAAESAPLPMIEEIVLEPIKLSPLDGLESE